MLTIDEIKTIIEKDLTQKNNRFNTKKALSSKYNDFRQSLYFYTQFLDDIEPLINRVVCVVEDRKETPKCKTCGIKTNYNKQIRSFSNYCSSNCAQKDKNVREKIIKTNMTKYGSTYPCGNEEINEKKRKTCREKYNSDFPFQNEQIQKKARLSTLEKYGVVSSALHPDICEKQKQTRMKNFGSEFPFQSKIIQDKVSETHQNKFGAIRYSKGLISHVVDKLENKQWLYDQHFVKQKSLLQISKENDTTDLTVGRYLHKHGYDTQHFSHSTGEKQVLDFVKSLLPNTEIHSNTRKTIPPYELDIYIPSYNLAIEYCGLYWHSDKFKENYYHRNKLRLCQQKGIRLLTIFEDEWINKQLIVQSKIRNLLHQDNQQRVYARNTSIVKLNSTQRKTFLEQFHIQGNGPGSITYGLIDKKEQLVAVMTFIKRKPGIYDLNRYATSQPVIGGFSKLLKHFTNNYQWKEIISFADLRWSDGNLYEKCGFELDKKLPPDYYWCKYGERYHKFQFRHKFLPDKLEYYDPKLSENQNCKNNGFYKIFNCGLNRYKLIWHATKMQ